jgi:hypothetical protein
VKPRRGAPGGGGEDANRQIGFSDDIIKTSSTTA